MDREVIMRTLVIKSFHMTEVVWGDRTEIVMNGKKGGYLRLRRGMELLGLDSEPMVAKLTIRILPPGERSFYVGSIMDFMPISVKTSGKCGEGTTHTLTGVYAMLTGHNEVEEFRGKFGADTRETLDDAVVYGRPGTPSKEDIILWVDAVLKGDLGARREEVTACCRACDKILDEVRSVLRVTRRSLATETHIYEDKICPDRIPVLLVKQLAGQGAMHDNLVFPNEPSGTMGARSLIDLGHVPLLLSPNEYRDGALHAIV